MRKAKKRLSPALFFTALAGAGCSLVVSYDGYGDGVREEDGGDAAADATAPDVDATSDGGAADGASADAGDAGDASKRYAVVLLGGEAFDDAGSQASIANVEVAAINPDGTLAPWSPAPSMPGTEDLTGATSWGSSVFVMDDFGAAAAVMQPDGGLSAWSTIANLNRNTPRMAAVDGRIYVASGETSGDDLVGEVYYAEITGPLTIGPWTATSPLTALAGGPRIDSQLVASGKTLYLVGGDLGPTELASVVSATIDGTGTLGPWSENTQMPSAGDNLRAIVARDYLTVVGGSWATANSRTVYTAAIGDGGVLGPWQLGPQHPSIGSPTVAAHGGFVYLIGGETASNTDSAQVLYAPIEPSGLPGAWQATASLTMPRHGATAVIVEMP